MPIADTYVASGQPDTVPSTPDLKIFWVGHNQTNGFGIERALLKFDLSTQEIPVNSNIQSARLVLTLSGTTKNDGPLNITINRISEQWAENLTWNAHLALPTVTDKTTTIAVGSDFKQYEWDVKDIVQEWANTPTRTALSLRLNSDQTSGDHERNFWSKDCKDSECNVSQRPRLIIEFETPTPTRTATVTPTPTPTIIPTTTPTPSIEDLELKTNKPGEIATGEQLIYRLEYKFNNSGNFKLEDIVITDTIPAYTQLITNTMNASDIFTSTYNGYVAGSVITWTLQNSLSPLERGNVSYRVIHIGAINNTQTNDDDEKVIYNDGMDMSWTHNGQRRSMHSNSIRNPPHRLYLPVISK